MKPYELVCVHKAGVRPMGKVTCEPGRFKGNISTEKLPGLD